MNRPGVHTITLTITQWCQTYFSSLEEFPLADLFLPIRLLV
jgi:hypothetical protein